MFCGPRTPSERILHLRLAYCGFLGSRGLAFFVPVADFDLTKYKFSGCNDAGCLLSGDNWDVGLARSKRKGEAVTRLLSVYWNCCDSRDRCCETVLSIAGTQQNKKLDDQKRGCKSSAIGYKCPQDFSPATDCGCYGKPPQLPAI